MARRNKTAPVPPAPTPPAVSAARVRVDAALTRFAEWRAARRLRGNFTIPEAIQLDGLIARANAAYHAWLRAAPWATEERIVADLDLIVGFIDSTTTMPAEIYDLEAARRRRARRAAH